MKLARTSRGIATIASTAAIAVGLSTGAAVAFWTVTDSTNPAATRSDTLPTGANPTATSSGTTATLTFSAVKTSAASGQVLLTSYQIRRYASSGSAVGTSTCTPTITAGTASCSVPGLPAGTWWFTDAPMLGSWVGGESAKTPVSITVVTSFSITAGQTVSSLPATLSGGSLSGFTPGEALSFHLDSAAGATLTSTVSSVDAAGTATGFTVTVPAGTAISGGTHQVVAVGASSGTAAPSNAFSVNITPAMTLSAPTTLNSVPGTLTAALTYFQAGETVTFRLDNAATGTVLNANGSASLALGSTGAASGISLAVSGPISRGAHTVYAVGSAGSSPSAAFAINTTSTLTFTNPPLSTATLTGGSLANFHAGAVVTFTLDGSGAPLTVTGGSSSTAVTTGATGAASGFTVNLGGAQGSHTIVATDTGGDTASYAFTADTVAPTTTDNTAAIGAGWHNTAQTVTLTATDPSPGSGVATTYYTTDGTTPTLSSAIYSGGITLSADGTYVVKYFSVDVAGNREAVKTSGTVKIDRTAPVVTALAVGPSTVLALGFISVSVSGYAYANATDNLSGVAGVTANLVSITGVAGDTAVALSATGGPWVVGGVTYAYRSAPISIKVSLLNGSKPAYTMVATDNAGNSSGAQSTPPTVTVDNIAPTATDTAPNGWQRVASVTVTINPKDEVGGSGLYGTYYTTDGSTPSRANGTLGTSVTFNGDGNYTLNYIVYDNAGNSLLVSRNVQIDRTAPVISALAVGQQGRTGYVAAGQASTVYAAVSDATSGVNTVKATLPGTLTSSTSVTLTKLATPVTINGVTYNYTGPFTTAATLSATSYSFSVTSTDLAGNSVTSAGGTVNANDTTAPQGLTVSVPGKNGTYTGTFSGTAGTDTSGSGDLTTITILVTDRSGHTVYASSTVPVTNGTWSITNAGTLASGPYTLVITQSDNAGNTTTVQSNFQV